MKRLLLLVLLSFSSIILAFPNHWGLASAKDLKIAMILWRGETEAEKGFQQDLKEFWLFSSIHRDERGTRQD